MKQSLNRARDKVIPFVPDGESLVLAQLANSLEEAAREGDTTDAKAALDDALAKYAYLF